jgi:hypothetical protein
MRNTKKYIVGWSANNSTFGEFFGSNLKTLKKEARAIVKGNTFAGNSGSWSIDYNDSQLREHPIASGGVSK